MSTISEQTPDYLHSRHMTAALLLAARPDLSRLGFAFPTVDAILAAAGVSRARAYELRKSIEAMLPTLLRPTGRPPSAPPPQMETGMITEEVLRFCLDHPGSVWGKTRRKYSDGFRCFVTELRARHSDLDTARFAKAVMIPYPTLEQWLRAPSPAQPSEGATTPVATGRGVSSLQIESILVAWKDWHGPFTEFVSHVNQHLHIPFRHTMISSILSANGSRIPDRRGGRSPDEKATRRSFETFFAGAQWVGDGSATPVVVNGKQFGFNVELEVDAHTGAFVGASVRDEEDGLAVKHAFQDAVSNTGAPPLAQLLDNRSCNDTNDAISLFSNHDTILLHATKGRPQNDAHVEGAFGLFKTTVPPIVIQADSLDELARAILTLVVIVWGRTCNHRQRQDRNGRSRFALYQEKATPEQVTAAREALAERLRKQKLAQATLDARQNPFVRAMLDKAFVQLGLDDHTGNLRSAISRYPLDAVIAGVGVFVGKRDKGTLAPNADGRYLLGIVRNVSEKEEGTAIADALWRLRGEARELIFATLECERRTLLAEMKNPPAQVTAVVTRAFLTDSRAERSFWLHAVASLILAQPTTDHEPLFRVAARRIHGAFRVPHRDRLDATRILASRLRPTS